MSANFTAKLVQQWLDAQGIDSKDTESAIVAKVLARLMPVPVLPNTK